MMEGMSDFFETHKKRAKSLKLEGISVRLTEGRYYGDDIKFEVSSGANRSTFHVRMLESCCGVQELIRPRSWTMSQAQFDFVMEAMFAGLKEETSEDNCGNELWGNQIILTTSIESDRKYVSWCNKMQKLGKKAPVRIEGLTPRVNPRTGNQVKIWRVVV